jgi:hypothetical protein
MQGFLAAGFVLPKSIKSWSLLHILGPVLVC